MHYCDFPSSSLEEGEEREREIGEKAKNVVSASVERESEF